MSTHTRRIGAGLLAGLIAIGIPSAASATAGVDAATDAATNATAGVPTHDAGAAMEPADAVPLQIAWSDEFDEPAGTPPNSSRWGHDIGGGGWGNAEHQYYTI